MGHRLLLVTNAAAGSAEQDAVDAAVATLRAGADVAVVATEDPADLDGVVARRDGRRLVVAGGDGSLHALVAALHRRDELAPDDPVGLVPLGTGNDLARALGLPLDPAGAARVALSGEARRLDLIVDDAGGIVVNAVHAGVGAEAARRADAVKGALGPAAYAVGSVAAGVTARGWRLRVAVDGQVVHDGAEPVLMVAIGNGTTVGGGAPLTPDAAPDDGLLDVVVARATGPLARVGYATALPRGGHVDRPDVLAAQGREVTVSGEEFPVNADGELADPATARSWRVAPGAWSVLVPGAGRGQASRSTRA